MHAPLCNPGVVIATPSPSKPVAEPIKQTVPASPVVSQTPSGN